MIYQVIPNNVQVSPNTVKSDNDFKDYTTSETSVNEFVTLTIYTPKNKVDKQVIVITNDKSDQIIMLFSDTFDKVVSAVKSKLGKTKKENSKTKKTKRKK